MDRLCIRLFGTFQVALDGEAINSFTSNKVRGLLAYLAVEANQPHNREKLTGLLWPDYPEASAHASLRSALTSLRLTIGDRTISGRSAANEPYLYVSRQAIQFNLASSAWVDVIAFADAVRKADLASLEQAANLYQGDFLEGFSIRDASLFEEWALLNRERYRRLVLETLDRLVNCFSQLGEYEKALPHAWLQVELDPWRETAHQQLMQLLAISGRRTEALIQYETCCRLLAEELGVQPTDRTIALYERIRSGQLGALTRPPIQSRNDSDQPPPFPQKDEAAGFKRSLFVRREEQLSHLHACLDLALSGQGRADFICGSAGSGKTALMDEFARQAMETKQDLVVANGECSSFSGFGDPYLPFRGIFAMLTGDVQTRWSAGAIRLSQARRLREITPATIEALLEYGPQVLEALFQRDRLLSCASIVAQEGDLWLQLLCERFNDRHAGTEKWHQSQLFQQTTNVLREISISHPLLLILDDLQWADPASLSLLFHLGRRLEGSRILLLLAYRPEEVLIGKGGPHSLQKLQAEFRRAFGEICIDLDRVDRTNGRAFIDAFLDTQPNRLGKEFRRTLSDRTDGQPLFTIELLRSMQERDEIYQDGTGCWSSRPVLEWEKIPARVEGVIEERIDRLDEELRGILNLACVEGEQFTTQIIAQVLGMDEHRLLRNLSQHLERRHRLVQWLGGFQLEEKHLLRYRFAHGLFQQYLYSSLSPGERRLLHRDIASVMVDLYEGNTDAIAPQLARHYSEAGDDQKALQFLTLAADSALASYANDEAEVCYRRALALTDEVHHRAHLVEGLGSALYGQSCFTEAIQIWREGIQHYQTLGDLEGMAGLYSLASEAAWWGGDPLLSMHLCEEGLEATKTAPESRGQARLLHAAAQAYFFDGSNEKATSLCLQALQMAERLHAVDVQADVLATLGGLSSQRPLDALEVLTDAVKLAESRNLLRVAFRAYNDLAIIKGTIYGPQAGCDDLERSVQLSRKAGNVAHEILASGNLIEALLPLGEIEHAEACLKRIRRLASKLDDPGSSIQRVERLEATILFYQGEWLNAISRLRLSQAEFRKQNHLMALFIADSLLARSLIEMCSLTPNRKRDGQEEVTSALTEAIQLGEALAETDALVWCYSRLAAFIASQGQIQEGHNLLAEARNMAKDWLYPTVEAALLWGEAQMATTEEQWEEAVTAYESLVEIYTRCGMRWEQARTLVDWALVIISQRDSTDTCKAQSLLQEAYTLFREMGIKRYSVLVREHLEALSE